MPWHFADYLAALPKTKPPKKKGYVVQAPKLAKPEKTNSSPRQAKESLLDEMIPPPPQPLDEHCGHCPEDRAKRRLAKLRARRGE